MIKQLIVTATTGTYLLCVMLIGGFTIPFTPDS